MPQKKTTAKRTTSKASKAPTRKAASPQPAPASAQVTHEMIARRAYEIWLTNIKRAYQPAQDWLEAEKQLRAELKKKPARAKRAAAQTKPRPQAVPMQSNPDSRLAA